MSKDKTPMSVEELMKPRCKAIADFPGMNWLGEAGFSMGEIFSPKSKHDTHYYNQCDVTKYPHLFKKLEWWEERDVKDMPEYVKCHNHYSQKVIKWEGRNFKDVPLFEFRNSKDHPLTVDMANEWVPCTEEEYRKLKHNA